MEAGRPTVNPARSRVCRPQFLSCEVKTKEIITPSLPSGGRASLWEVAGGNGENDALLACGG